ncbi:hypothetical protein BWD121_000870 [Bartonella sp. WD12.1]|nr:hypothetical protein BWD121_000870 [Bartonella sp. WD12.1]
MRRVLKHHVCFCFLSTALLAGVSLIAAQEKVYAGSLGNCKGDVDGSGRDDEQPIVCNGSDGLSGGASDKVLRGDRNIDMSKYPGWPAVEVYGENADITMSGTLRVTNGDGRDNTYPAIKVHGGGVLKLVEATVTNVHKGIVADGGFVTVMAGSIKIKDGGVVVEVSKGGRVTLNNRVAVIKGQEGSSTGITGIEVGDGGGTVELMDTSFTNVKTGIMIKGAGEGKANVTMTGKGKIEVGSGGKGIVMQGTGEAEVTGGTIEGSGSVVGAVVSSGTLTLMGTSFTKVTMGAEVKGDGKLKMTGGEIRVTSTNGGTGLSVGGTGSAIMMGGMIVGKGGETSKGVVMMGEGEVTLMGTTVESFLTGVEIKSGTSGTVTLTGGSKIVTTVENGVGVSVAGGTLKIEGSSTIEAKGTHGVGIKVEGTGKANVNMMGGKIQGHGNESGQGVGVDMAGENGTVELTKVTVSGFETGVKVTNGTMKIEGSSKITATGQKAVGVEVKGTGVLKINGESTITAEGTHGVGIKVEGQGKAEVTGGEISIGGVFGRGATMGVSVTGTGEAELKDVTIKGNGKGTSTGVVVDTLSEEGVKLTDVDISEVMYGVSVSKGKVMISGESKIAGISTGLSVQGGTVTMTRGTISEGGVYMSGGTLTLEDVTVSGSSTGVSVTSGKFVMRRGSIKGNGNVVNVTGGDVTLEDVTVSGSGNGNGGTGVYMAGGKSLTMTNVTVSKVTTGVSVSEGASGTLTVKKGEIKEFKTSGVNVEAAGVESVSLEGTKIIGKGGGTSKGVSVGSKVKSAELTLTDVTVSQVGTGVYVKGGATASLTLTGVTIEGVEKGVQMLGGKKLTMTGGSIGFTRMGVMVQDGEAKLMNVKITGSGNGTSGTGVYATGGEVTLTDVTISQVGTGVMMSGGGTLMMTKGEIKGFTTEGVSVGISVTRAELTGTRITGTGASEYGVYVGGGDVAVRGGSSDQEMHVEIHAMREALRGALRERTVRLEGVQISGVQKGVHVTGGGTLTMNQGSIEFKGNGYGVYVGKGVTKADLTNVTVTGKDNKGVGVYAMGGRTMVMTLTDVKISEVTTGLYMMGKGELTVSGNSTTINFAGGYGVYVGDKVKSATNEDGD